MHAGADDDRAMHIQFWSAHMVTPLEARAMTAHLEIFAGSIMAALLPLSGICRERLAFCMPSRSAVRLTAKGLDKVLLEAGCT